MQSQPPGQRKHRQRAMLCVGVFFGVIVGQLVDLEDLGKLRLISLTGRGALSYLVLVVGALLVVIGDARLTAILHPIGLVSVGAFVLLAAFAGPGVVTRFPSRSPVSIPFVPHAILEFVAAALVGSALQRIVFPSGPKTKLRREGPRPE